MAENGRFCLFDDTEVRPITKADREWGKGPSDQEGFVHSTAGEGGVPNCGRRVLTEDQTYTMGISSGRRDDE